MNCGTSPNATVGEDKYGAQYWQFQPSLEKHATCGEMTYLRPDIAGAILPWPYSLAWLLIHAPLVLIRVARWEKVQALSLFLAAVSIAWSVQAFSSTERKPEEILVWTPLTIILDVGAMIQLAFLVVEDAKGESTNGFGPLWATFKELMTGIFSRQRVEQADKSGVQDGDTTEGADTRTESAESSSDTDEQPKIDEKTALPTHTSKKLHGKAIIVILSILLFIGLVALQILGLVSAIQGLAAKDTLEASFCSPMFQSFTIAVLDGNCRSHTVSLSASKGIGCIMLPGNQQAGWLTGTVATLAVSLALQLTDVLILTLVESGTKWREIKMRRPWCTMFAGIAILIFYVIYGTLDASRLPSGMTEVVWVFRKEPSLEIATVCQGTLTPAGIRGAIMGWTDGFLSSWGRTYFG